MIDELTKVERQHFLNLVYLAISSDELILAKEKDAFNDYAEKLGLDCHIDTYEVMPLEDTLKQINYLEKKKKKIIFSEIIGVLISDDIYDETEKEFVINVGKNLNFSDEEISIMESAVIDYIVAYGTLMEIVNQ